MKNGRIHRILEPLRWPQAPVDVEHERVVCQGVQVILAARGDSKYMPDPLVLIANCLTHDRPLPPPSTFLVHAAVLHRALCPPPVAAVEALKSAGRPALCVTRHDPLQVLVGWCAQEGPLVLVQYEAHQAGDSLVQGRLA